METFSPNNLSLELCKNAYELGRTSYHYANVTSVEALVTHIMVTCLIHCMGGMDTACGSYPADLISKEFLHEALEIVRSKGFTVYEYDENELGELRFDIIGWVDPIVKNRELREKAKEEQVG